MGIDLDWMQSLSIVIGAQRQTELIQSSLQSCSLASMITCISESLQRRKMQCGQMKDILESMGEVMDVLKECGLQKITPKPVLVLSPGYAHLPDGLQVVYAMIALLSEGGKYDVIIPAPDCEVEARNMRPHRSELPAVWSEVSRIIRYIYWCWMKCWDLNCPISADSSS